MIVSTAVDTVALCFVTVVVDGMMVDSDCIVASPLAVKKSEERSKTYKSVVDTVTVDNIAASMLATAIVLIDYYSLQL